MVASVAGVAAATTPSALVSMKRRPAAVAQGGSACASTCCGCSIASAGLFKRLLQALGGEIRDRIERDDHVVEGLPAVVENLHKGADADGGEKCDDQHRNGAAQEGLGGQQPPIRRLGDRLREAL